MDFKKLNESLKDIYGQLNEAIDSDEEIFKGITVQDIVDEVSAMGDAWDESAVHEAFVKVFERRVKYAKDNLKEKVDDILALLGKERTFLSEPPWGWNKAAIESAMQANSGAKKQGGKLPVLGTESKYDIGVKYYSPQDLERIKKQGFDNLGNNKKWYPLVVLDK